VYSISATNNNPQLNGTGVTRVSGTTATGVFTVNATSLTAGIAYSYAVYATNSAGTTYSSIGTFTTSALPTPTLIFANPLGAVTTIAGTGIAGAENAIGTSASFNNPNAVAVDSLGNVYVADVSNNLIRKIVGGVTSTLAGSGSPGSQNGTGAAATFYRPYGIALDSAGNVYVADSVNNLIRKISPAGVVTTLAGSGNAGATDATGTAASFNFPTGVAVDAAGNVYVGDQNNHKIRMITAVGVVTTLAGSGTAGATDATGTSASFNTPGGLAVDSAGTVYVADQLNNKVRKVTALGVVTTLAGSGSRGAIDASGTAASFWLPAALAVDSSGTVFVADQFNQKIRSISAAGVVTTLAGTGRAGAADGDIGTSATFNNPGGIALDGIGNLIIGDLDNHNIRKVTLPNTVVMGGSFSNIATSTLAGGTYGAISYASAAPAIASVNATSGVVTGIAPGTTTITATQAATSGTNATATQFYTITVIAATPTLTFPTAVGAVTTLAGSGTAGAINAMGTSASFNALGLAVDNSGNVYLADTGNHLIRKISAQGLVTTLAGNAGVAGSTDGTGTSALFNTPKDVAVDNAGNVYVADTSNHTIRKITAQGVVTTLAGTAGSHGSADGRGTSASFYSPTGVAVDRSGNVYVADVDNYSIRKITATGTVTTLSNGMYVVDVEVDASGDIYYAGFYSESVGKITTSGVLTVIYYGYSEYNSNKISSVTVDSEKNVYFSNYPNSVIRKLTANGVLTTLSGFRGLRVILDGLGNLYSLDQKRVYKISSTVELAVGASVTHTVSSTLTGGSYGAITYASSDPSKVTVHPTTGLATGVGVGSATISATQAASTGYNTATVRTYPLVITAATPAITWATPSAISFGTALSATQLNASCSVPGRFSYSPAIGAILSLGTQTLTVTFTPTDTVNYNSLSATVAVSVVATTPAAPTNVAVTTTNGQAAVSFTQPSSTGGGAITNYTIRATATDGSVVISTVTGSPATITGLTPGKSYQFTVTANNGVGAGTSSISTAALSISLLNQTITFPAIANRASNSGSFNLAATASSGLPVTFNVMSGPATLAGSVVTFTGVSGPVTVRVTQSGNARYLPAPNVDVTFTATAAVNQAIFAAASIPGSTNTAANLAMVNSANGNTSTLLLVSSTYGNLNGAVDFRFNPGGTFTVTFVPSTTTSSSVPIGQNIQGESAPYTISGSLVDNVLKGTIEPMGLTFNVTVPETAPDANPAVGFYKTKALAAEQGVTYSVVGPNNEMLVLTQSPTATVGGLTTLKADGSYSLAASTAQGSVTLSGVVNPVTTAATATLTLPGNTKIDFSGLSSSTTRTDRLINLSSRAKVGLGESVLITGFVIGGTESKKVLIRAAGPALTAFGLASALPNPAIKIYQGSSLIAQNDDWNKDDDAEISRLGAFAFIVGSKDAALLTTLAPGAYTAQITDPSGTGTGVALAEIYDASINPNADYQRLVNISSRGRVTPDDGVLIGGFIVTGNSPKTLLIRGIGPALSGFGIAGTLADPALTIYQDGKAIATNEGWANRAAIATAAIQTGAFTLPSGSKDAAVVITLNPGAYTAQIKSAKNASSGVALIEIYEVP
jgi:sugar lactone lactonase YvrE